MMEWLFFDLDNTLVDFSASSVESFGQLMKDLEIDGRDLYPKYQIHNIKAWKDFENGIIDEHVLRTRRFAEFFTEIRVIADPVMANRDYLAGLISHIRMYPGVAHLIEELKTTYKIAIVTNGLQEVSRPKIELLGLDKKFDAAFVSGEVGAAKPTKRFFDYCFQYLKLHDTSKTMIIGDSQNSDIRGGNDYGMTSVWISHGRVLNEEEAIPDLIVDNVLELPDVLLKYS